ncbi:MAG: hypothetical protein KDD04_09700, partial [Sinomicrobium sp.]|nr:hypothetical protein [Sinomicrobium sp.]
HFLEEKTRQIKQFIGKQPAASAAEKAASYSVHDFVTPRSYACEPFDLNKEMQGMKTLVDSLLPPNKQPMRLVQWSGNTLPFEGAIRAARQAGLYNINGGDSRFDREFASYAWVAPIGQEVGKERQIYSSNSNENTYTELWTDRFYGFRYLQRTVENTESPIRVKPFNIYYHMYSGEKEASLLALTDNYNYARTQELTPVTASRFAYLANGFYTARFIPAGKKRWEIHDRGGLQTIRFDHGETSGVDFARSRGIIGQRHYQNSLYVYLDETVTTPIVALKENISYDSPLIEKRPYLISSRWLIKSLNSEGKHLDFLAWGYGKGAMSWRMPARGVYHIRVSDADGKRLEEMDMETDEHHELSFTLLNESYGIIRQVEISPKRANRAKKNKE